MNLLDNQNLRWKRYTGKPQFGYPVDCSGAVLEGELLVIDIDPNTGEETGRVLKKAGRYAHKPAGDTHIEVGGPEGALVLFSIYAPYGNLVEALARDGSVADTTTLAPILESQRRKRS